MDRINLSDVTFIIPFHKDSEEREENLIHVFKYLNENFNTTILVLNSGFNHTIERTLKIHKSDWCDFRYMDVDYHSSFKPTNIFHRTKVLNIGIKMTTTKYDCIHDTDVIFSAHQAAKSLKFLYDGATLVYPYDGKMLELYRDYLKEGKKIHKESYAVNSFGGAFFANKEQYVEYGMENENFIGWGSEDAERVDRVLKLGGTINRVDGDIYHIEHPRGINSSNRNPYWEQNNEEYEKIKSMDRHSLFEYIKTWQWTK